MDQNKLETIITNLELADNRVSRNIEKIQDGYIIKDLEESVNFIRVSLNELRNFEVKQEIEQYSELDE